MAFRLTVVLLTLFLFVPPGELPAQATKGSAGPDSTVRAVRRDSLLAPDSSLGDYMQRRERFSYPATSRQDPFDSPFGKNRDSRGPAGPGLADMELTGVLYSPDGLSVAIMNLPGGSSFLLREGDYLGAAEVGLIEKARIHFRIKEYGLVRTVVKDLKPLVEGADGKSPEQAGGGGRQQESRPVDESGGPAPRK
jgi:hypothetical protein